MNRSKLKAYAPQARRDFIQAVTDRAALYGLTKDRIEPITEQGDVAIIAGKAFPRSVAEKRRRLEERIERHGFEQIMEATAYTWFNRLVAIRFMELHGYLDHGYRVVSHPEGKTTPEILEHAEHVDLLGLDKKKVIELKLDGTKESELYRMLLIAQCNALHRAMPFLFERIDDETELLLPNNLLHSDSLIRKLVNEIDEEDWQAVEIIGWLYQFYISDRKAEVIGKVVKSEDIPAATQLFTPNWIVKYLVENSLGRQWLTTYPNSPLRRRMEFYIEPAEQTPEVQAQLKAITPTSLNPEELTLMDPACGSGHILVEAYDLLKEIYLERGYRLRDIPKQILIKNLFGLEVDDRAAQLAAFTLIMKARADDRRIFDGDVQPNVLAIQESNGLDVNAILQAFTEKTIASDDHFLVGEFGFMGAVRAPLFATENRARATIDEKLVADLKAVLSFFKDAKTYGSLLKPPEPLAQRLPAIHEALRSMRADGGLVVERSITTTKVFVDQAALLASRFGSVVTNPPYMGSQGMNDRLKEFAHREYPTAKYNLLAMFMERATAWLTHGHIAMVTLQGWMFQDRYEAFRRRLLKDCTLLTLAHLGPNAFPEISGEVVQTAAFCFQNTHCPYFRPSFMPLYEGDSDEKMERLLARTDLITDINYDEFRSMPDAAFLYWASRRIRALFASGLSLRQWLIAREGMATADNDRFLRQYWEVDIRTIERRCTCPADAQQSRARWFPYIKGGEYRRWYGNDELLVNWFDDGVDVRSIKDTKTGRIRSHNYNGDYAFRSGISWSSISSNAIAARYVPSGFMFDAKGPMAFPHSEELGLISLAIINSVVGYEFMRLIAPSLDFKLGHVEGMPVVSLDVHKVRLKDNARACIAVEREDWAARETSPEFQRNVLVASANGLAIEQSYNQWLMAQHDRMLRMKALEEENNRILVSAYGLDGELAPDVALEQVTLDRPNRRNEACRLASYTLGCAMGRYSLDKPGLIYANSGNQGFDLNQYKTFPADKAGIIPVTEIDWFADDGAHRFEEFLGAAWPKEHLEENLKFIAESLGPKNGELPRDTIRRYFADEFVKDHLQMYKRRPIYWLFTSGKLGAFQCFVYLHRYNEGTLARMRTEYVIPLQGKISQRIEQLAGDITAATSMAHRRRLVKEHELLKKYQAELLKFDEKLRHYADQRIKLDLDDGVKVNYGKFGDLLAEVKTVCGKREEE